MANYKLYFEDCELGFVNIKDDATASDASNTLSASKIYQLLNTKQNTLPIDGTASSSNKVATQSTVNGALVEYQPIKAQTIDANTSYDTGIFANKGTATSGNNSTNKLLRQKAFLVMLNMVYATGDRTSYQLGIMRIGRNGGNVTFTPLSTGGDSAGISALNNIVFSAGTGDDDTVIITNNNNANIMVDILL